MTSTPSEHERPADPASAAATWFARLQDGDVSLQDQRDFQRWLNADPRHADAWGAVNAAWDDLSRLEDDPALAAMRADALSIDASRPRRPSRRDFGLAAAGLIAAAGGAALSWRWLTGDKAVPPAPDEPVFTTAVGERSTFRLPDNSVVTLGTDSAIRVHHWDQQRRLTLLRGQAYFEVAKDKARPFIVAAGDKAVTAVGTAFDVRLDPGKLSVTLVEGRVRIAGASPNGPRRVEMSAGSRFVAADNADWTIASIDTAKEAAWVQGRLVFDGEPLSTVVAEMNRFSTRKLTVSDAALAATPVSGVFKTGQVEAFATALRTYGLAEIGRSDPRAIELVPPARKL
ncbi:FecR domain-containing protein [Caulobacter segnis]|uniref:Iron dicitrate transport regulator FecR n=1 Tax=Caulobacter segnis TaxID=88688 RepID=A0A2W5V3E9_9CAUL|nr:FecR domain-containing protein [Caulobacter segnis]PZR34340.1 MAG: iron dicitrate transport regulator FecR [Caulobacter segnis]